jgi:hypothetical protein
MRGMMTWRPSSLARRGASTPALKNRFNSSVSSVVAVAERSCCSRGRWPPDRGSARRREHSEQYVLPSGTFSVTML